jgi:hypothetical protein
MNFHFRYPASLLLLSFIWMWRHRKGVKSLGCVLFTVLIAPLAEIKFKAWFAADVCTSLVKVYYDFTQFL